MPIAADQHRVGYRPTVLNLAREHCLRAVDHYEAGADYDRTIFAEGVAAHAVLHALGEAARAGKFPDAWEEIADAVCLGLATVGRTFEGAAEPPMSMDSALAGKKLALDWAIQNPPPADAHYELGAAVGENWDPVPYSPSAHFRLIFDFVRLGFEMWEEGSGIVLHHRDYKSDWPADRARLDTIQMRAQTVMAHIACSEGLLGDRYRGYAVLRREIVNLRTGASYSEDLDATEAAYKIERWRKDLELQISALGHRAEDGLRPASPGGGCFGCPWLLSCDPAQKWLSRAGLPKTEWERGVAYAVACGTKEALAAPLKAATAERSLELRDGWYIGTQPQYRLGPTDQAYAAAWEAWEKRGGDPRGFALSLRLTKSNLEGVAWALWPGGDGRDKREAFLAENTTRNVQRRFGIYREDAASATDAKV